MWKYGVLMLFGVAAFACGSAAASTRTTYNGRWSGLIITDQGTCDRGYRYAININDGVMHYDGDAVEINGLVARNGAVSVTVSRGDQQASGQGHLDQNSGQGVWSSAPSGSSCSGRWEAERH